MMRKYWGKIDLASLRSVAAATMMVATMTPCMASAQQAGTDPRDFKLDPTRDPARSESVQRQGPDVVASPPEQRPEQVPATPLPAPVANGASPTPEIAPPPTVRTITPPPATTETASPRKIEASDRSEGRKQPAISPAAIPATATTAGVVPVPSKVTLPAAEPGDTVSRSDFPVVPVAGGIALLFALLGWLFVARRRHAVLNGVESEVETDVPILPTPIAQIAPAPAVTTPITNPVPASGDARPAIEVTLDAQAARLTLMGATVGYRITLRNIGRTAARDIAIRLNMANADAQRQEALAQFFAGAEGQPAHNIDRLEPGEERVLTGEYMLRQGSYTPFQAGERLLLIPILACDARYAWGQDAMAQTAAAWVVGCEHEPPDAKLAAFRLDQGPRMFSAVGCRRMETAFAT